MSRSSHVSSPCTGVCRLNARDVCVGCGRTRGQIARWAHLNEAQRRFIMRALGCDPDRPATPAEEDA